MNRSRKILNALFYAVMIILVIIYCHRNALNIQDDAFITYRYSQNLIAGNGLVFNVGERYYGSTAMGFAILLGAITYAVRGMQGLFHAGAPVDIPDIAVMVSGLSMFLVSACWYGLLKRYANPLPAFFISLAIGIYFFACRYSGAGVGMETTTYFALAFCSAYLFIFAEKPFASAVLLALAVALRPDAFLFAIILFFAAILDYYLHDRGNAKKLKAVITAACIFGIGVLLWESAMYMYFRSLSPETMEAKKAQVLLGYWPMFNLDYFTTVINRRGLPGFMYVVGLVLIALLSMSRKALVRKDFFSRMLSGRLFMFSVMWMVFGIGLIAAYTSFHITAWLWYELPIYFALLSASFSAMLLLFFEGSVLFEHEKPAALFLAGAVLVSAFSAPDAPGEIISWSNVPRVNQHLTSYDSIVEYLRKNEPGGATVATAEVGALGYKLGPTYKVIDYLGLISPGVSHAIVTGDRAYYFNRWRPDYIIISWEGDRFTPTNLPWFKENYTLVGEFKHPYWEKHLKRGAYLYKRMDATGEATHG